MPYRSLLTVLLLIILNILPLSGQESSAVKIRKVVLDAGHGGRDPGAVNGKVLEKNITLSVTLKLGEMIKKKYPEVEVIYTRDKDVLIPLDQRSEIANKNKADLFMSIHVNSAKAKAASGSETFVMGIGNMSSNMEVLKQENSVIMLEGDDYKTRYEGFNPNDPESYIIFSLLQNAYIEQSLILAGFIQDQFKSGPIKVNRGVKQLPLLVLHKTTMPSILTEIGFLSNTGDLNIMNTAANQTKFATMLFNAFEQYKVQYESGTDTALNSHISSVKPDTTETSEMPDISKITKTTDIRYRIQIMASGKLISLKSKEFKGVKELDYIKSGTMYKYTVGNYSSIDEAKTEHNKIKKIFPQAFIIKIEDGTIVPID